MFFGWQIPARFEQGGEFIGGCLLIALGLIVGWLTLSGRLYVHAHVHEDGHDGAHRHWHLHLGRQHSHRPTIHTVLPGVLGAVFAMSGLRALILSLPLWNTPGANHFWSLLFLVAIFAIGILLSMSLFGIVLAHTLVRPPHDGPGGALFGCRHRPWLAGARDLLDRRNLVILLVSPQGRGDAANFSMQKPLRHRASAVKRALTAS